MFVERVDDNSVSEIEGQRNSFQKCLDDNSTMEHDTHAQVDVSSFGPSSTKRKTLRKDRSKRRKLSDSEVSSLGSTQEGASPPAQDVRDCSVRDTSSNHLDEATASGYAGKMVEEVVAGHGTSFLVAGDILLEKASAECPDGESESGEQDEKIKMENSEEMMINGQSVAKDDEVLDVRPTEEFRDKPTTISLEETASDDTRGSDPSVENRESDNLGAEPKLKDTIPSASQLGAMTDDVIGKEGPRQMLQSSLEGTPPGNFRKKLIVLDVNGLLADIIPCVPGGFKYNPDTIISNKAVFKRPYCDDFLQFCFERFHVGVWSSRTKKNVDSVLDFLMRKSKCNLLFCWDQSHCTITGFNTVENRDKPLLLKELRKLWEKHEPDLPWERGEYNESNTLLLDDSPYKALRNPPHTAIFPYTYQYKNVRDNSLGPAGDLRVYLEGLAFADNVQKYVQLNPFGQRPITETNLSWAFYLKVIGTTSSPREENANDSSACLP